MELDEEKDDMKKLLSCLWGWLLIGCLNATLAQDSTFVCDQLFCKSSTIPIPVLYYTPETRLAAGGAILSAFHLRGQSNKQRPSQVQCGLIYTQNKQLLFYLPFQFFSKQERFQFYGELGYYQYVYQLYGIGNETADDTNEFYDADFPRLRINGLMQFRPNWYAGVRYAWDDYSIPQIDSSGLLSMDNVTGQFGGVISGLGALLNYDSRNQVFYPTAGWFMEGALLFNRKELGSDFNFGRYSLSLKHYYSRRKSAVWAAQALIVSTFGDPPFQELALLGGPNLMRGYFEGRFRDRNLWVLQGEYRFPLFWRFGGVLFAGMGNVAPRVKNLFVQQLHVTYGIGGRFTLSKQDHINLRLDIGGNERGELFPYITIGEAF